jgi:hypothetical protein
VWRGRFMNNLLPSGYVMTADGQILYSGPRFDVPPVGSNGDGPDADSMGRLSARFSLSWAQC